MINFEPARLMLDEASSPFSISMSIVSKCISMQNLIKFYHVVKSYEYFHLLTYTGRTNARQSLVTGLNTSGQIMLKCISEQYLIKIYHVVQEL